MDSVLLGDGRFDSPAKSTTFVVSNLLSEVVNLKMEGEDTTKKLTEIKNRMTSPKNIAYTERPNKSLILAKRVSKKRFKRGPFK